MTVILRFPLERRKIGRITKKEKIDIKDRINIYHESMNVLYNLETVILQETQTEYSEDALDGIACLMEWHYNKIQELADQL